MRSLRLQPSHSSERYYKSRIPISSNTRGCNHVQLNIDVRFQANLPRMPGLTRTANGGHATVAVTAATRAPHIPGAMRIAVRDAGCPLARSPNGGTPQSDHMARQLARIRVGRWARSPASSKKSTALAARWNGLHSGCRCAVLPCMLPLRQPSLLLQLGWPPVRLV